MGGAWAVSLGLTSPMHLHPCHLCTSLRRLFITHSACNPPHLDTPYAQVDVGCWAADPGVRQWMDAHGLSSDDTGAYLALQVRGVGGRVGGAGGYMHYELMKGRGAGVCGLWVVGVRTVCMFATLRLVIEYGTQYNFGQPAPASNTRLLATPRTSGPECVRGDCAPLTIAPPAPISLSLTYPAPPPPRPTTWGG